MNTNQVQFTLSNNSLTGTIPVDLLSEAMSSLNLIQLDFSANKLTGAIQPSVISNATSISGITLELNLGGNSLTGPLVPELVDAANGVANVLTLDLSGNPLGGTIPSNLISNFTGYIITIGLNGCGLSGTLPPFTTVASSLQLYLANNKLSAPASWSSWFVSELENKNLVLDISNNSMTGAITIPSNEVPWQLALIANANDFTSLVVEPRIQYLVSLSLARNRRMTGSLPAAFLNGSTPLQYLNVNATSISGDLPVMNGTETRLLQLFLSNTSINFCPKSLTTNWTSTSMSTCELQNVNVDCFAKYPPVCQYFYAKPRTSSAHSLATPTTATLLFALAALLLALL